MRLFVALELPSQVCDELERAIAQLKPESSGARWSKREALHLTLKFLGNADEALLPQITTALAQIHSGGPVSLHMRGVAFFPDEKRPRVMFCGVEASPNLPEVAASIETILEPLGFERESREYVPHVTLARLNSATAIEKLVAAAEPLKSYDFGAGSAGEFHLYQSVLKPAGSEYKKLATFSFVKDAQ
ncbi:MAG TPA: RNA 2',3'-cyclic phosphodiesterase [Candidatus Acidoferrales bacterium]